MRINFDCFGLTVSGGVRVVFELASRLIQKGNAVSVTALARKGEESWFSQRADIHFIFPPRPLIQILRKIDYFYNDIGIVLNQKLLRRIVPDCDVNIATFCLTARPTIQSRRGKPFYLVQNYEPWFSSHARCFKAEAKASYDLPIIKLCVSKWLQQKVGGIYIGNGVDTSTFHPYNGFEDKEIDSVIYLYRDWPLKGDNLALETLRKLHCSNPKVRIHLVAGKEVKVKPGFPFKLHINPTDSVLAKLYSKVRVLLFTSDFEGFGLPPLEAFACGTNVVSTDFLGNEYLTDGANCRLANKSETLASKIQELFLDNESSLSQLGRAKEAIKQYDFDLVTDRILTVFKDR